MLGEIVTLRVDDLEAEGFGELEPARAHLTDDNPRATGARDECDEETDRPTSDHDRDLAVGKLGPPNVVAGNRERLGEGREPEIDLSGQPMQGEGGHRPRALERTGSVDTEELQVAADMADAFVGRRLPALSSGRTTTSSPIWKPSTFAPSSATVPDISCPMTCGALTR